MSMIFETYNGYALNVDVIEGIVKDEYKVDILDEIYGNNTGLPYPLYCFEDNCGSHFIVFETIPLVSPEDNPCPLKIYTFKEVATMIYETFQEYIDMVRFEGDTEAIINQLIQGFEQVSLAYYG